AVEKDPAAAATYAANFVPEGADDHMLVGEIEHWVPQPQDLRADVVIGGPPCQGFSGLGKEDPDDPKNKLWRHYVAVVKALEPKVFVIENVDRFLSSPEFRDLKREVGTGGDLANYRLVPPPDARDNEPERIRDRRYLLNAADYGVPQTRRRAIVIGVRKDVPELSALRYPAATHRKPIQGALDDGGPTWQTVESVFRRTNGMDLLKDLPERPEGYYLTRELHIRRNPEKLSLARYKAIPAGGNRKALTGVWYRLDGKGNIRLSTEPGYRLLRGPEIYLSTESWDGHRTGTGDVMGRLHMDRPAVTIRTEFYKPEKGRYLHPTDNRPITHFEAALLQGFPEDFKWCGSKTEIARQ
ncbi:DNA cytosine methyltransferase, partial [Streptomyces klenkii]